MAEVGWMNALEDCLLTVSPTRLELSAIQRLLLLSVFKLTTKTQTPSSTQSSSGLWRSGQLLWSAVALSSTALELPSKVANGDTDTQVCRRDVHCF